MKFGENFLSYCSAYIHFNVVELRLMYVGLISFYHIFANGTLAMVEDEVSLEDLQTRTNITGHSITSEAIAQLNKEVRDVVLLHPFQIRVEGRIRGTVRYFGISQLFYFGVFLCLSNLIFENLKLLGQGVSDFRQGKYVKFTLTRGKPPGLYYMLIFGLGSLIVSTVIGILDWFGLGLHRPHITYHVVSAIFVPSVLLLVSGYVFLDQDLPESWVDVQPDVVFQKRGFQAMLTQSNHSFASKIAHLVVGSKATRDTSIKRLDSVCDEGTFQGFVAGLHRPLLHAKRFSVP